MITLSEVSKSYRGKRVVNHLTFSIQKGEVFALLGSNGAGKSTTIKMMLGLVRKDEGSIVIANKEGVGYSPETPYFPQFLTGMEVLQYYGRLQKLSRQILKDECCRLLQAVGLENDKTTVRYYSKGMLQRLALAQAMLGDPAILILDEPCAGLDAMGRIEMLTLVGSLKKRGKTILINSHILSDMERVCDKGIIMEKGNLLRSFTKSDITQEHNLEQIFKETVKGEQLCR